MGDSPTTAIDRLVVGAYSVATDAPEADGTASWSSSTMIVVEAVAGGCCGVGYTYGDAAVASLIPRLLAPVVVGEDAFATRRSWYAMQRAVRNAGREGIASMAISAVDAALWDLAARLLDVPLCDLLGRTRESLMAYGSGGFTSYDDVRLSEQLRGFAAHGVGAVKLKVGTHPEDDLRRVGVARAAVGDDVELFIDANGAYSVTFAAEFAVRSAELGATWFEEPVSSDDLAGLRFLREHSPVGMTIAAGEYGWDARYYRRMLEAGAVDVVQADATRCLGITGFLQVAALACAFSVPLSAHCAPALHLHPACAAETLIHIEWFHDHVRIEHLLLDGAPELCNGQITADRSRAGNGLTLRRDEAERYALPETQSTTTRSRK
jgi:L-alanine-DL-glutamate epimerase-like enolase superfamily enzyme